MQSPRKHINNESAIVVLILLLVISLKWNSMTFGRIINIDSSQTIGWTTQCCYPQCCDGNCCGWQTCCDGTCCGWQSCCDGNCCGWQTCCDGNCCGWQSCCDGNCCGYQTCCTSSCCGAKCCTSSCCGAKCCTSSCCGANCCASSCCGANCCTSPCCGANCCTSPCCGAQCCRLSCCGSYPSYYRQTNNINDTLIGSWQENAPSNWTILSGYVRFTLHGDCAAATVNVEWNRQQIGQVSVSNGGSQNVEIPLNNSVLSSIIRGGTNNVTLNLIQNGNCVMIGGVNFGSYPNSTTIIQIELIYCGESNDLETPKECDGGAGCNETTCECERTHGYTPLIPIESYCFGCGNGIYDPPLEECDSGLGCLPNCLCDLQLGYRVTIPPSKNCNGCGNSILDVGEECDSGLGCLSNCTCDETHYYVPTQPLSLNCTKCGNAILDVGEQCDSGIGCDNVTCQCLIGWKQQGLVNCAKCGNGMREAIEECDGGLGCLSNCTCDLSLGYHPTILPSIDCVNVLSSTNSNGNVNKTNWTLIGGVVGGLIGGLIVVGGGLALLIFIFLKRKEHKSNRTNSPQNDEATTQTLTQIMTKTTMESPFEKSQSPQPQQRHQLLNKQTMTNNQTMAKTTVDSDPVVPTVFMISEVTKTKKRQIPFNELQIEKEIGSGTYGKVFLGEWKRIPVALKFCAIDENIDEFLTEINIQIELPPHPNVVQMYGVSIDGPQFVLVLEYCAGGSLDRLLFDDNRELSEEMMLKWIRRIAAGMYHLHRFNVIHRDLAARNILLTKTGEPKVSDFGLSRFLQEGTVERQTLSTVGPVCWMSPESLKQKTYSKKTDVWMFGMLVYEIVARREPHSHMSPYEAVSLIRDTGLTPEIPSNCPPLLRNVMERCWQIDPNRRPSFEDICLMLNQSHY